MLAANIYLSCTPKEDVQQTLLSKFKGGRGRHMTTLKGGHLASPQRPLIGSHGVSVFGMQIIAETQRQTTPRIRDSWTPLDRRPAFQVKQVRDTKRFARSITCFHIACMGIQRALALALDYCVHDTISSPGHLLVH